MELFDLLKAGKLPDLTSSFSIAFLAGFLPIFLLLYLVMPKKAKKYWLLLASYLFFWLISGELISFFVPDYAFRPLLRFMAGQVAGAKETCRQSRK